MNIYTHIYIHDLGLGKAFLRYDTKSKINIRKNKWTLSKSDILCYNTTIKKVKRQSTELKNVCKSYFDKGRAVKIYKDLLELNNKRQSNFLNGQSI